MISTAIYNLYDKIRYGGRGWTNEEFYRGNGQEEAPALAQNSRASLLDETAAHENTHRLQNIAREYSD